MKNYVRLSGITSFLLIGLIGLAACAPAAAPTAVPATEAPASAPTDTPAAMAPTEAPTAMAPAATETSTVAMTATTTVSLELTKSDTLGEYLADGTGRTLYLFTKDTKDTSTCTDKCAQAWPPLISSGTPSVGAGLDATLLGSFTRADGTTQVTYNGWPLYYFGSDTKAGDATGQAVGKVWWVISGDGFAIKPAALQLANDSKLGQFLADGDGLSLYTFAKDTKDTSACYSGCDQNWPPLLETGAPTLGTGVDQSLIGSTVRQDGSVQVTYNGMPLYYFAGDKKAGDLGGEGKGSVWYVIGADGKVIQ